MVQISLTIPTLTFFVFLVLKLCNVIAWSWWWVTAPIWISFGLWMIFLTVLGLVMISAFGKIH